MDWNDMPRGPKGENRPAGDFEMKGFIAACIAVGILWVVDAELNGGRYGDVVKKAVISVLPGERYHSLRP
jgi:hypothetical protein